MSFSIFGNVHWGRKLLGEECSQSSKSSSFFRYTGTGTVRHCSADGMWHSDSSSLWQTGTPSQAHTPGWIALSQDEDLCFLMKLDSLFELDTRYFLENSGGAEK